MKLDHAGGRVQAVSFQPAIQRAPADAQHPRRRLLVACGERQGLDQALPLDGVSLGRRRRRQRIPAGSRRVAPVTSRSVM